jgi:predicted nucleic acid-binding protein
MSAESPVLVDTSIWIEVLRQADPPLRNLLDQLIAEDRVRICAAILAELLQGATTAKDLEAAENLASALPILPATDKTWLEAGKLNQKLRSKGISVGLLDCYLAVLAQSHECILFSLDKHFPLIARHSSLQLMNILRQ